LKKRPLVNIYPGTTRLAYDPDIHRRRTIRLRHYDYSQAGMVVVTICACQRECFFGNVSGRDMALNDAGRMVGAAWYQLPERFAGLGLDAFVIMPNHIHGIFILGPRQGEPSVGPVSIDKAGFKKVSGTLDGTVGRIVQAFKSITTNKYIDGVRRWGWKPFPGKLWQRNYWEHVIRNDDELTGIREYIHSNPVQWACDSLNATV